MKTTFTVAVTLLAVFLLSGGNLAVTNAATPPAGVSSHVSETSQQLSLNIQGGVVSAGNQHYKLGQEGQALEAVVGGYQLIPSSTHLEYNLNAQVNGMSTTGSGRFTLTGQNATGSNVRMHGNVQIVDSVPAVCFPSFSMSGTCAPTDTSQVPAAFVGIASVEISWSSPETSSGNGHGDGNGNRNAHSDDGNSGAATTTATVPMMFESPYFNPFGDAISFGSVDNSIAVVTNYTRATIDWTNVNDAGAIMGTVGTTPVAGVFLQVATEHENL
ncbi:MAG: hypothetical protein ACRDF4_01980, partial [Rhabdochlamydiaceae bacterium]